MKKIGTAKENILMIAGMSDGFIKKNICREIAGTKKYYEKIMWEMEKAGEIETIYGIKPRVVKIKKAGIEKIKKKIPWITSRCGYVGKNDRIMRCAQISQVIYNMQLLGVKYYPEEKEGEYVYYAPVEVKQNKDELKSSKMCGLLVGKTEINYLYNMENKNVDYYKKTEMKSRQYIAQNRYERERVIIFGEEYEGLKIILENMEREKRERMWNGKAELNKVTPDHNHYYIPNGEKGVLYLKILLHPQTTERARRYLEKKIGEKIHFMPVMHLGEIRALAKNSGEVLICLEEQVEIMSHLLPGNQIYSLTREAVEKMYTEI